MKAASRATRFISVAAITAILVLAFTACGSNPVSSGSGSDDSNTSASGNTPASSASSESSTPAPSDASGGSAKSVKPGVMTMAEYMSNRYASFDSFDQGIRSGEEIPPSLRLYVAGEIDGYVHDENVIAKCWNALCDIRIDTRNPVAKKNNDEYISFSFDSYKEVIPFPFNSTKYADFSDGDLFTVKDPEKVDELVKSLSVLVKEEWAQNGTWIPEENGAYLWDADGDGNPEHLSIRFIDNGDEAPSVLELTLHSYITDVDATGYIDFGYSVDSIVGNDDVRGPYILINYSKGDNYYHGFAARCKVRLIDGELVVEEL